MTTKSPMMLGLAVMLQASLVLYHQTTTLLDFFPFNGARFYSARERLLEAGTNFVLMSLPQERVETLEMRS